MGYTNITTKTLQFKRVTVADGLNPDTTQPVSSPSELSDSAVSKSWRLIQGKPRVWYEKVTCAQFDEDEIAALARKAVWFEAGSDYFRFFTVDGFTNQTDSVATVSAQALQKTVDFSALTYNSLPARLTLALFVGSALSAAKETITYQLIWDDTQGYKTPEALKQTLLYGMAFACSNDDETYPSGDLTQYSVSGSVNAQLMLLRVHTADVQLEAENLSPGYNDYVSPTAAATLTWSVKEPEAYFTTKPTQAQFEVRYNVSANGELSSWKTLTGTTAQEATIPAIDLVDAEAFNWSVRIKSDDGVWGEWSSSIHCTCVSQSGKAVALSPDATSVTAGETVVFLWEHSSLSGAPQTRVEIQFQAPDAAGYVTIYTGGSAARRAEVVLPEELADTAGQAAWRVRTQDMFATWSEWSDPLYVYVVAAPRAPTVTVLSSGTMKPVIGWQSENQTGYRVKIRDKAGETVYDSGVMAGSEQSHKAADYIPNGQYTAAVTVWNQYALESAEGTAAFTVQAAIPAAPVIRAGSVHGGVRIAIDSFPDGAGTALYRDGQEIAAYEADGRLYDLSAGAGTHRYTMRAQTDDAFSESAEVYAAPDIDSGILAKADAPEEMICLRLNRDGAPSHADDLAMEATQRGFAGRALPVVEFSGRRDHIHRHTFALPEREEMQKLMDMLLEQKPMLYRDQYGRRYYCVCTALPVTYDAFSENFTLELLEIDYREG